MLHCSDGGRKLLLDATDCGEDRQNAEMPFMPIHLMCHQFWSFPY